jgi:death on curing protein
MQLITLEQLLQIHALIIQETGGSIGLRDLGRLEAALATQTQNVFGEELYENVCDKAAALMRAIISDHPFVDGNKRTGVLVSLTFLRLNAVNFHFSEGEVEDFAVTVVTDRLDVRAISAWLSRHTS